MKIINKRYYLSNKLNKRIVLISDIHYCNKNDIIHLNKVLDKIKKIKPDYICVPGDTLDKSEVCDFKFLVEWLIKLSNVTKVIMSLGNHEFYIDKRNNKYGLNNKIINKIKKVNNLYFLDNQNIVLDNINFIGMTLPIQHYMCTCENEEEFKEYIKDINPNKKYYNVLLCHSPVNISKKEILNKTNFDLVLCGHMHSGVVPRFLRFLFGNKGLVSPQKKLFPSNVYGNIRLKDKNVIITSGIKVLSSKHFGILRNVFPSEIAEINL